MRTQSQIISVQLNIFQFFCTILCQSFIKIIDKVKYKAHTRQISSTTAKTFRFEENYCLILVSALINERRMRRKLFFIEKTLGLHLLGLPLILHLRVRLGTRCATTATYWKEVTLTMRQKSKITRKTLSTFLC